MDNSKISSEMIESFRGVTVACVADALWEQGVSAHMSYDIKPITPGKIVGPAMTIREEPVNERLKPTHAFELIDNCKPGHVIAISVGGFRDVSIWGGILTAGAIVHGLEGAVLDGGVRDIEAILRDTNFPIFARSISPASTVGRFKTVAANEPVVVGGITIYPDDLIIGDRDGVVVVPNSLLDETLRLSLEIYEREVQMTEYILKNKSLVDAAEKFKRI